MYFCILPANVFYLGCFAGSAVGIHEFKPSVVDCRSKCVEESRSFAGVREGDQCICHDEIEHFGNITGNVDCGVPCTNDTQLFCGGLTEYSVYMAFGMDMNVNDRFIP